MTYSVKEMFLTIQGEGHNSGRVAVFCRFTGCNLWSGLEEDRESAICNFCDTKFVGTDGIGGGKFKSPDDLATAIDSLWPADSGDRFVVCTGGEPLLQLDTEAIKAISKKGFEVAVETNGTIEAPPELDWICVSPKPNTELLQSDGNELKLVYPQGELTPEMFDHLDFDYFYLQPMDNLTRNMHLIVNYCKTYPQWRLSIQMHKSVGIP